MNNNEILLQVEEAFRCRKLNTTNLVLENIIKGKCVRIVVREETIPQDVVKDLIEELEDKTGLINVLIYCDQ